MGGGGGMGSLGGYAWTDNIEGIIHWQVERTFDKRSICQYHKSFGLAQEEKVLETLPQSDQIRTYAF